jgi:isochorismate hydrolase
MVEDCCAALSDDEHRSSLETLIQQFGDVLNVEEVLSRFAGVVADRDSRESRGSAAG